MKHEKYFDTNGHLLANNAHDWRWNNLGYWSGGVNYGEACRALARLHGEYAQLQAGQALLELACGYGAAFDIWHDEFGVNNISGLEYRSHCVQAIQQHQAVQNVVQGSFDQPLASSLTHQLYDAVVCVDAAYHAQSLDRFLATACSVLKPQGKLVFSTLMLSANYPQQALWTRVLNQRLLKMAHIKLHSVLNQQALIAFCVRHQLHQVQIIKLNQAVLAGFVQWVQQRHTQLSWQQKYRADWQKIYATARWCQWLLTHNLLDYVLVCATKS